MESKENFMATQTEFWRLRQPTTADTEEQQLGFLMSNMGLDPKGPTDEEFTKLQRDANDMVKGMQIGKSTTGESEGTEGTTWSKNALYKLFCRELKANKQMSKDYHAAKGNPAKERIRTAWLQEFHPSKISHTKEVGIFDNSTL